MKAFRFSLERVMQWRATQLRAAEERLAQAQGVLAQLAEQERQLIESYQSSAANMVAAEALNGDMLQTLGAFRERTLRLRQALGQQKVNCETMVRAEQQRVLEAKRQHRVLEKLRESQWKNWSYLHERELENNAADNYLANWVREDGGPDH